MQETFSSLGKDAALEKLYEGKPFKPVSNPRFECADSFISTSSCTFLEGVDFDLSTFPLKHLGYKALVCATGELMASLATPRTARVTISLSAKLDLPQVQEIWDGICEGAKSFGYEQLALDVVPSLTGLGISICATGSCERKLAVSRPIAKSMDLICISNNPGASFLGSQILSRKAAQQQKDLGAALEPYKQLVGAFLRPELSPNVLKALKDSDIVPSFGYFCREHLSAVLRRLSRESGLGVKVYVDKIPFAGGSIDTARELGVDPLQAALKGGDDNCLLFTIPIGSHEKFRHDFQHWDIIGHLAKKEVGTVVVSPDSLEHPV